MQRLTARICGYNYSLINYHYIIKSVIMFVLWMIYKYVANMHVWTIILSISYYEWCSGYNMYNEDPPAPNILPV
jgi:hypothetical protein